MKDLDENVLESLTIQLEKVGLSDMIKDLSDIYISKSHKILLLRKLLLVITSDCGLENKTDEEVLHIANDYGFCVPEDFLNLEDGILQNEVKFWNRIFKCINYLGRDGTIKENVPNTQDSTYNLEEIANIFDKTPEESSLGCAELESDKHNVDDDSESLINCELGIKDLIKDAHEALSYLTVLSKHTQRFVANMQDLSYHSDTHCTDSESGPPSIINDPAFFKRIELLHQQVKMFDEVLDSFNSSLQVAETKHLKKDATFCLDPAFLNECEKILMI